MNRNAVVHQNGNLAANQWAQIGEHLLGDVAAPGVDPAVPV